ncbi:MAG: translation initiation factor IF-2 [Elusimicrobium sp.]|jgi:translation initiation factor IF-2|nr:translation initiation factor IF-2 [Elusimicrobium sp.]
MTAKKKITKEDAKTTASDKKAVSKKTETKKIEKPTQPSLRSGAANAADAAKKEIKKIAPKQPVKKPAPKKTAAKKIEEEIEEEAPRQKSFFTPAAKVVPQPVPAPAPAPAPVVAPKPAQPPLRSGAADAPQPAVQPKPVAPQPAQPKPFTPAPAQQPKPFVQPQPKPAPLPAAKPAPAPVPQPAPKPAAGPAQVQPKPFTPAVQPPRSDAPKQAQPQPKPFTPSQPKPIIQPRPFTPPQTKAPQPKPAPKPAPAPQPKPKTEEKPETPAENLPVIKIVGTPTVKELAEKMDIKIGDFIKKLMGLGIYATINQRLESEIIELIVAECGFKAEIAQEFVKDAITASAETADKPEDLKPRAPVVTIMGHVDHGKTSLLDAIRKSNVVAGEAGAITQHIGAYRVKTPRGYITFLDTPGHEAFTAMRARGAQATDIVILVVSATDGIMPQTIEAMDHAKAAGAPIIVAVNKIDLPGANPDKVKQELANRGLIPEEWQGKTIYVEISAKKRINIEKLLEMVSLQAEMMELKANPNRAGVGVILESKRDNKRGIVATVLVQKGTIKVGDPFIVGTAFGKVRALIDENSVRHQSVGPSVPAEILGINGEPPQVGESFFIASSERDAKYLAEKRKLAQKEDAFAHRKHISLMNLKSEVEQNKIKKLDMVLKGDVQGSIEAIKDAMGRIPSDEVEVSIIHSAAGNVNESDILLAKASNAVVIAFNVDVETAAAAEAEREGIEIRQYQIIFELLEDIKAAMEGLLEPEIVETVTGRATVRQVFNLSSGIIAGSFVDLGKITRGGECKIFRGAETVFKGKVSGLKRFKDDVKEVEKGYECGILIEGFRQIAQGDIVECFKKESITRRIKM